MQNLRIIMARALLEAEEGEPYTEESWAYIVVNIQAGTVATMRQAWAFEAADVLTAKLEENGLAILPKMATPGMIAATSQYIRILPFPARMLRAQWAKMAEAFLSGVPRAEERASGMVVQVLEQRQAVSAPAEADAGA